MKSPDSGRMKKWKNNLETLHKGMSEKLDAEKKLQKNRYAHPDIERESEQRETFDTWQRDAEEKLDDKTTTSQNKLNSLSPQERYHLSRLDSHIRHSVVEACFYNLKLLSQLLPEKHTQPGFVDRITSLINEIPNVEKRLLEYFAEKVGRNIIGDLFPEIFLEVTALMGLIKTCLPHPDKLHKKEHAEKVAEELPDLIDKIMSELLKIKTDLEETRIVPWEILTQALTIQNEALSAASVKVDISAQPEIKSLSIHGDKEKLLDVFIEIIRNTVDHAFSKNYTTEIENWKLRENRLKMINGFVQ